MTKLERLKTVYAKNLAIAHSKCPTEYAWPISELNNVLERMNKAIDRMSFNKDSTGWKLTCKELGIKHTYQAIENYLKGDL